MDASSCKRLLSALYISVNGAFFQRSIHSDHMAPEHIVVLVPGGKTAAGRYCKLGEEKASWTRVTNVMKKLVADQETWDKSLRAMAAQKLTAQANEWLADNDQTDREAESFWAAIARRDLSHTS